MGRLGHHQRSSRHPAIACRTPPSGAVAAQPSFSSFDAVLVRAITSFLKSRIATGQTGHPYRGMSCLSGLHDALPAGQTGHVRLCPVCPGGPNGRMGHARRAAMDIGRGSTTASPGPLWAAPFRQNMPHQRAARAHGTGFVRQLRMSPATGRRQRAAGLPSERARGYTRA